MPATWELTARTCSVFRCYRLAAPSDGPDDPLCTPHRVGLERRAKNVDRRRAEGAAAALQEQARIRQERYVRAWREEHQDRAYTRPWCCPLCGLQIQSTLAEAGLDHDYLPARGALEAHQAEHGTAWGEYQAAGRNDDH